MKLCIYLIFIFSILFCILLQILTYNMYFHMCICFVCIVYVGDLHIKKGLRENNPQGKTVAAIAFIPDDGMDVFVAKVKNILLSPEWKDHDTVENGEIFFKRTKAAPQRALVALDASNFIENLEYRFDIAFLIMFVSVCMHIF